MGLVGSHNLRSITETLKATFNKTLINQNNKIDEIYTKIPSSSRSNRYEWIGEMPKMRQWLGEREIQNLKTHNYTVDNYTYEVAVGVNKEDVEDDQINLIVPRIKEMAIATAEKPRELIVDLLTDGDTDTCYDTKAFFADDHPVGSSTFDNLLSGALSADNVGVGRYTMMQFTDARGRVLNLIPNMLVVPPELEQTAREITESQIRPSTNSFYKNVWAGTVDYIVDGRLTDANDWYMLCTTSFLKPFILQEREAPKFVSQTKADSDTVFYNKKYIWGAQARWGSGYFMPQLAIKFVNG